MSTVSPSTIGSGNLRVFVPYLPAKPRRRISTVRASSASSPERRNPLTQVLDVPKTLWKRTLQPLSDFGFGSRSIWEGGVGLFMVSGAALLALSLVWLRGFYLRSQFKKYQAVFEFSQACGICLGTPVRIRGVTVGSVIRVDSSLKSVDAVVEVEDDKIIIPRNSSIEGLIVCDKERMKGQQGVSLDELVGIFTRLGREMEEIGITRSYRLAEKVASVVEDAKPLLEKIEAMATDIQPLLAEVRDSALLKDIENLMKTLSEATEDLRRVRATAMSPENAELIRQNIFTLIFTLKNLESISSDLSGFTGDETTRRNLKSLIKSLSRLL
ncbi:Mce/MlaD domain-containing protein [Dioscorea alata]|uniref:Mce/MlaD domain-containing protein n=1 Tax=Dioscorea alata TaxID=55571 RepID=A0ACB7VG37_DIOAL|nr:Mce/MlaD domain-containing protein [Dioscorea alata]